MRAIIFIFLIVVLSGFFWTQSKYPAPNEKTSRDSITEGPIVFEEQSTRKGVSVKKINFQKKNKDFPSIRNFYRGEGQEFGIGHTSFSPIDNIGPYHRMSGIAATDLNLDGFVDFILADDDSLLIYENKGNNFFEESVLTVPFLVNKSKIGVVAFADINNDGWQDIYFSTLGFGNYFLMNSNGVFTIKNLVEVPNGDASLTGVSHLET